MHCNFLRHIHVYSNTVVAFEVNIMKQGDMSQIPMQADFPLGPPLLGGENESLRHLALLRDDHDLLAFAPVNQQTGKGAYHAHLLGPLRAAFPHGEERTDIRLAGHYAPANHIAGDWVASSGHIAGIFAADLFGIPATGQVALVRFGRFERYVGGQIAQTIVLLDLPSLMMQAGVWPLSPPMGPWGVAPGPRAQDGIVARDIGGGAESLALVQAMIGGLHKFKGDSLKTMGMRDFWTEHFWWYGPAPIGNFRGHADYERGHQLPFLTAFPDRVGGNHRARIGEGAFVASTGWPSITATHKGGGWLGLAPTDRSITMRVMDFWRRDGDRLDENWVMIDLVDLLSQMGLDVFARMKARNPYPSLSSGD
jgi:SnoaL-like polyketide cyclase